MLLRGAHLYAVQVQAYVAAKQEEERRRKEKEEAERAMGDLINFATKAASEVLGKQGKGKKGK